ncbi:Arp2/3 complex 16 kDa subunit ARPC5 [Anaeromyces robustus]|uniref:Actin-related protein 2/3 complex subunit 5 n=1 Tax=Anaeromyces robustus TaxID=1754192 RepID=A0A1Y1WSS4_9FUNG|nr:Arp2/3 complex 16 kDa subunit ARPC5 [Anaeromyces robustus]|eukprot:ORX76445.1 Arp2/3 complex 16 kDa subunit ARPC5 [Anaeromyces robustus]
MSANRKLNVDIDEDFEEEVEADVGVDNLAKYNSLCDDVKSNILKGDLSSAIKRAVSEAFISKKAPQDIRERCISTVIEAMCAVKTLEIPTIVKQLTNDELDILMKFVYVGMASPEVYNSSILITWHEKIVNVAGLGCIVRVLTDRNTV